MKFLLLVSVPPPGVCTLESLTNVEDFHLLKLGESMKDSFPDNASLAMNRDTPKNVGLADVLFTTSALLVVSEKFKKALESIPGALTESEILKVAIINHKGRPVKEPYFIIHQLNNPPAVDEAKTKGKRSKLEPDRYQFIDSMVLDESKIPRDRMLFRPKQFPRFPFIRTDLIDKLAAFDLTGYETREMAGHDWD